MESLPRRLPDLAVCADQPPRGVATGAATAPASSRRPPGGAGPSQGVRPPRHTLTRPAVIRSSTIGQPRPQRLQAPLPGVPLRLARVPARPPAPSPAGRFEPGLDLPYPGAQRPRLVRTGSASARCHGSCDVLVIVPASRDDDASVRSRFRSRRRHCQFPRAQAALRAPRRQVAPRQPPQVSAQFLQHGSVLRADPQPGPHTRPGRGGHDERRPDLPQPPAALRPHATRTHELTLSLALPNARYHSL